MFSLIPKTDVDLWLGSTECSPPVALYPRPFWSRLCFIIIFLILIIRVPIVDRSRAVLLLCTREGERERERH